MPSFYATKGQTIEAAFAEFHAANPAVYEYFKKYALHILVTKGRKLASSKLILNRIRWEVSIETIGADYKINDAYTPHYARLFIRDYPQYAEAFELRQLRAIA